MNDVNPPYYLEGDYAYYYTIARLTKKDKCILIITHVKGQYFYTNFKKSRKKVLGSILFSQTSYLEFRYGSVDNINLNFKGQEKRNQNQSELEYLEGLRVLNLQGTKESSPQKDSRGQNL